MPEWIKVILKSANTRLVNHTHTQTIHIIINCNYLIFQLVKKTIEPTPGHCYKL